VIHRPLRDLVRDERAQLLLGLVPDKVQLGLFRSLGISMADLDEGDVA
jgi:hypothetical protein